jgi:hypothetical protein
VAPTKPLLGKSGTGDEALGSVALPAGWTVSWGFQCPDSKKGTFVLTETAAGAKAVTVTNQTGLGGNGHKPYTTSGTYSFAVTTTCGWQVNVGSTATAT